MEFVQIQRKLAQTLLKIPVMETYSGRNSLLQGLPKIAITRSQEIALLDINNIISQLHQIGRLTNEGGTRPLIVVVENAIPYVAGTETSNELIAIQEQLEAYYGGDTQPEPKTLPAEVIEEALIFGEQRDTRLPFSFIHKAEATARSLARLTVPRIFNGTPDGNVVYGPGWMIAPGILMTNHHVIEARNSHKEAAAETADFTAQAEQLTAHFDYYQENGVGSIKLRYARLLAANEALDYAVVELENAAAIADRPIIPLAPTQPTLEHGTRINIVQHPKGGPLRYAIRNNFFVRPAQNAAFIHYQTDTEKGASGSPVCTDEWQVIGLHHAAVRIDTPEKVPQEVISGAALSVKILNEAIQIHDILADLPADLRQRIMVAQKLSE